MFNYFQTLMYKIHLLRVSYYISYIHLETFYLIEDGQKLWPTHVGAIFNNKLKIVQQVGNKYCLFTVNLEAAIAQSLSRLSTCSGDRTPVGGEISRTYPRPSLRPTQPPVQWVPRLSRG